MIANEIIQINVSWCRYVRIMQLYIARFSTEGSCYGQCFRESGRPCNRNYYEPPQYTIRKYKPKAVEREKMQTIVECGINAPNGMNKQSWEVRVVDNPEFINGLTEIFKKENPKAAERPGFQNMFNNAPTVVFIANDPAYDMSQIDCGLLGENMILSAWSMGIGSCCLGGPVRFMKSPAAAEYMKQLGFSEGYELLYAIAFGYPDEMPAAKPREVSKVKFVD